MKKKKVTEFIIYLLCFMSLYFILLGGIKLIDSKTDKDYIIEEQKHLIESYVKKLKEKQPECRCEEQYKWYIDFYDEWHDEVGAFE